jgi:predicted flap endonuclease-1-like 5' DNA nuclease
MIYLSQALLPWWLAAFALGFVVVLAGRGGRPARGRGGVFAALALLALGAAAAFLRVAPGRAGFWLETAVLAGAAYGTGCFSGWMAGAPFAKAPVAPPASRLLAPPGKDSATSSPSSSAEEEGEEVAAPAARAENDAKENDAKNAPVAAGPAVAAAGLVAQALLKLMSAPAPLSREVGAPTGDARADEKNGKSDDDERAISRPPAMERPDDGEGEDELGLIRGVAPATARVLHELGVWRFSQIAAWGPEQVAWIARHFRQRSLVSPAACAQHWPPQARLLAAGALTDHARAVLEADAPQSCEDEGSLAASSLAAWVASLPRPAPAGAGDSLYAGARPPGFSEPPFGVRDDLTRIAGVDAERAGRLNGLGVWCVGQIARWRPENARWIGAWLATPGAPERDDWIGQARAIAARQAKPT